MRRLSPAVFAALPLLLGACGTGEDRTQAEGVVERFYAAIEREDGQAACDQLSATAAAQLESQSGQACREVVTRLELDPGPVHRTEVFVTTAKVDLEGGDSLFLGREPTGWKLTAIGCKPEQGKPADRPFECELES